jgi:hypothetical protein
MKKLIIFFIPAVLILLLGACSMFDTPDEEMTISGAAVKGPISNGTVTAYKLNEDGTRGDILDTTETNDDGSFQLRIKKEFADSAEIVVTNGMYLDEATGEEVSMGTNEFAACVAGFSENDNVAVTPITTMAVERVRSRMAGSGSGSGGNIETVIEESNDEIAETFGLDGVDITTTIPADLSDSDSQNKSRVQQQYGAVLAGFCQAAQTQNRTAEEVIDLVMDMAEDLEDGEIDGVDGGGETVVEETEDTMDTQNTYQNMNQYINAFMNGNRNQSGKRSDDGLVTVPEPDEGETDGTGETTPDETTPPDTTTDSAV